MWLSTKWRHCISHLLPCNRLSQNSIAKNTVIYFIHSCACCLRVSQFLPSSAGWLCLSCGSGWPWLLSLGWAQSYSRCGSRLKVQSYLQETLLTMMTEAQENQPNHSGTFPAPASITSANTPLAQESHLRSFKVKFGDYILCPEGGQSK